MNFVASLLKILVAAAVHLSTVKTASLNKGEGKSRKDVISLSDVIKKSMCQSRETLVDIIKEYPEHTEYRYVPSCVVVKRCGGCCNDEAQECVPTETRNVTLEVMRIRLKVVQHTFQLSFREDERCECRPKADVQASNT